VASPAKGICILAKRHGQAETAFLTGLLHDIGKIGPRYLLPGEDYHIRASESR